MPIEDRIDPVGREAAMARVRREFRAVLARAATEAARRERADWTISTHGPEGLDVSFSSTRPRVTIGFDIAAPEGDGPHDVVLSERGTPIALPIGMMLADGTGVDRIMSRLDHSDHWIALHMLDRLRVADAEADDRATRRLGPVSLPLRAFIAAAAVAGAYVLGGLAAD